MRVAAVQFFATPFALERNLETAGRLAREAASQGARLVVLPELFNTGYVYSARLFAAAEPFGGGPTVRWLARLSADLNAIVGGALLVREGRRLFNTFVLAEPNGKMHRYRKQHPFVCEHCYFESGDAPGIADTSIGRIGLLVCWDAAFRSAWEAYRGRVDLVLVASAPPRFHRAVLNFPGARKVYFADLMPDVLAGREAIDDWYLSGLAQGAALAGAPVASSVMSGRFVTTMPFARLSFFAAALRRPRFLGLARQAHQASLRASFYGCSAIFGSDGEVRSQTAGEAGWAMAEVGGAVEASTSSTRAAGPRDEAKGACPQDEAKGVARRLPPSGREGGDGAGPENKEGDYVFARVPGSIRLMELLFKRLGRRYYLQHTR